jgi:Phosphomannomutase
MDIYASFNTWLEHTAAYPDLHAELTDISGDEPAITDRFYTDLEFGTGGLRGVLGAGTNRMNIFTVGRCARGLAAHLRRRALRELLSGKPASVAIAYDSRRNSELFAQTSARILAEAGIPVKIYKTLMPTPSLSYAVRKLGCSAGIVVTASHNPAVYNGFKVYGSDGCQLTPEDATAIYKQMTRCDYFAPIGKNFEELVAAGTIKFIADDLVSSFISDAAAQVPPEDGHNRSLKYVYTPLNGTGITCVPRILEAAGFTDVSIVPEQRDPDGNFPTCPYPNPELPQALELGLKLCRDKNANLLLATDPDCDRVGVAVKLAEPGKSGESVFRLLNGNELGIVLLYYTLIRRKEAGTLPASPIIIKTIVTTDLVYRIAADFGAEVIDVLTGFKFIGEQLTLLERDGALGRYVFGFEESCGYLCGGYVRDKDGVSTSLLVCQAAEYFNAHGQTFADILDFVGQKYGYIETKLVNVRYEGASGASKMRDIMKRLRAEPPKSIPGHELVSVDDYKNGATKHIDGGKRDIALPPSDVLKFIYSGGFSVVIRPSGTEPQLKLYYSAGGTTRCEALSGLNEFAHEFEETVG